MQVIGQNENTWIFDEADIHALSGYGINFLYRNRDENFFTSPEMDKEEELIPGGIVFLRLLSRTLDCILFGGDLQAQNFFCWSPLDYFLTALVIAWLSAVQWTIMCLLMDRAGK